MSSRTGPLARLARLLLGQNELRRPSDRIEGCVVAVLVAAFLTATVTAVFLAVRTYQAQSAAAARLRPTVAVLKQPGPDVSAVLVPTATTLAYWRLPDGDKRTGLLSTLTAPDISYAPRGASVNIWLDRDGEPLIAPPGPVDMVLNALFVGVCVVAAAAVLLILSYGACRVTLERHRLARWESAWAAIGPEWTRRR
ncbi:MAG TPA: hypothetical protein VHU92_09355 [Streptosporangiaceae bacterium]|jgi:hypothetical protein|nr:hypothetical protein [Streptosporangiaceae bacterium]